MIYLPDLARWITVDPDNLDDQEKAKLAGARERCEHLDALAGHVTEFAKILTGLHGDHLDAWIADVEADDQPRHAVQPQDRHIAKGAHSCA